MRIGEAANWAPESCSLPSAERPLRVAEFDVLFRESVSGWTRMSRTRLELTLVADARAAAADLAARESGCCSFFTFTVEPAISGVVMAIEVPASQVAVLDAVAARVAAVCGESGR